MAAEKLNLQVGEEVDFYREPSSKDAAGWSGPAEVIDVSKVTRGVATVKWQTKVLEIQLPYLRRHLHFFSLLAAQHEQHGGSGIAEAVPAYSVTHTNVWACVRIAFEQLREGHITMIGRICHDGRWTDSSNNSRYAELLSAVRFYAANHMQAGQATAARIGK